MSRVRATVRAIASRPVLAAVIVCLLMLVGARPADAQTRGAAVRRYQNPEYLFAVRYPASLPIVTDRAPRPNHGLRVPLAPSVDAWVFASYGLETATTLVETVKEQRALFPRCAVLEETRAALGGGPATQLTLECPPESGRGKPSVFRRILAVRQPPERGLVLYEVSVEYPKGSPAAANAERVFRTLVDGFSFTGAVIPVSAIDCAFCTNHPTSS
ncbi:MAG TPA: hypothetical protein VFJ16_18540 [Longimicrobium sp.]|nr:hypothetical protein [Longimicrobium sp.]